MEPIAVLSRQLAKGRLTSVALTEACLERACDPAGEGARAFTWIDRQGSLAAAERAGKVHHRRIRIHRREGPAVLRPPVPQDQTLGLEHSPPPFPAGFRAD